jgi:HlyD family secretion protein
MKRVILVLLVLAAGAGIAAYAYWFHWLRPEETRNGPLVLYGNVDIRQVDLGFRVSGRIAEMRFEEGDLVAAGKVMSVLDKRPFDDDVHLAEADLAAQTATLHKYESGSRPAEIAQARALVAERKATLDNAVLVLKRQEELVKRGNVSQQAYDNALAQKSEATAQLQSARAALELALEGFREEDVAAARANLQMAEARLARAQTDLADTVIVAPAEGVILSRIQEPGAIVAAGAPVYTLSLHNPVWVRAYVREPDLGRVHPGMTALVTTDSAPNRPHHGHIGFISPVAEFTPKTVETTSLRTDLVYRLRVIVDDPNESLRQGMPVTVTLPGRETAK